MIIVQCPRGKSRHRQDEATQTYDVVEDGLVDGREGSRSRAELLALVSVVLQEQGTGFGHEVLTRYRREVHESVWCQCAHEA